MRRSSECGGLEKGVKLLVIVNDNDCSISPPAGALSKNLAKIVSTRAFNCAREISKRVLKPVPHLWEVAKLMERQTIGFFSLRPRFFPRLTSITTVLSTDMTSLRSLKS